ncbi:MAG: hypothetical protein AAFO91_04655 [Bacteroidota bacterium]
MNGIECYNVSTMPRERSAKEPATKKVAVKKVAKKVTRKKTVAKKTTARKRVISASAAVSGENEVHTDRKAPVVRPATEAKRTFPVVLISSAVCLMFVVGASVFVGTSDAGEINVDAVVQERKQEAVASGEVESVDEITAPTKNVVARVPNGGLRGKGKSTPSKQPGTATATTTVNIASSTASSSESVAESSASSTATSTEVIADEVTVSEEATAEEIAGAATSTADTNSETEGVSAEESASSTPAI